MTEKLVIRKKEWVRVMVNIHEISQGKKMYFTLKEKNNSDKKW